MNFLSFQIHLEQPVLASQLASGEENSSVSFDYIPGSVIRGAMINAYLNTSLTIRTSFDDLFTTGKVFFLNGYPLHSVEDGERMLPRPFSWFVNKEDVDAYNTKVYDYALSEDPDLESPKPPTGKYFWLNPNNHCVHLINPQRQLDVHNVNEDRHVVEKKSSNLYRYDALAMGQNFVGMILSNEPDYLDDIRDLIFDEGYLIVGGSRSAGYGQVQIQIQKIEHQRAYEYLAQPVDGDSVIITLLSDVVLRNEDGQFATNLNAVMGCEYQRCFRKTTIMGGFNRMWGLPLPQTLAIQAGSVFVYPRNGVSLGALTTMRDEGVGLYRENGFGRIAINLQSTDRYLREFYGPAHVEDTEPEKWMQERARTLTSENLELAKTISNKLLESFLEGKIIDAVSKLSIQMAPENAQLSRLRTALRQAAFENSQDRLTEIADDVQSGNGFDKRQFEDAEIDLLPLSNWLELGIKQGAFWRDYLQPLKQEIPSVVGVQADLLGTKFERMKLKFTIAFLDAVVTKTLREESVEIGGEQ